MKKNFSVRAVSLILSTILSLSSLTLLSGCKKEESYRSIGCDSFNGIVKIKNSEEEKDAYKGMHFYSGDGINVHKHSDLTMSLDADKFAYVEENTRLHIDLDNDSKENKTKIIMENGGTLNTLSSPLKAGEEYVIETPTSVMSVRGTCFRVVVEEDENNVVWAQVEVFDGAVNVKLSNDDLDKENDSKRANEHTFKKGESGLIRKDEEKAEFVVYSGAEEISHEINFLQLPKETLDKLLEIANTQEDRLCVSKQEILSFLSEVKPTVKKDVDEDNLIDGLQNQDENKDENQSLEKSPDKEKDNISDRQSIIPKGKMKEKVIIVDGEEKLVAELVEEQEEPLTENPTEEALPPAEEETKLENQTPQETSRPQAELQQQAPQQVPQEAEIPAEPKEEGPRVIETAKSTPRDPSERGSRRPSRDDRPSRRPDPAPEPQPEPQQKTMTLEVKVQPQIDYTEGQTFERGGMSLIAVYSDGTRRELSEMDVYTVNPSDDTKLTPANKYVTVTYTDDEGITGSTNITINVTADPITKIMFSGRDYSLDPSIPIGEQAKVMGYRASELEESGSPKPDTAGTNVTEKCTYVLSIPDVQQGITLQPSMKLVDNKEIMGYIEKYPNCTLTATYNNITCETNVPIQR